MPVDETRRSSLRIFLCHASEDKAAVRELRQRLRADSFRPWLDEDNLLPGQDWQLEIRRAVRTSDIVLVCLSCKAVTKAGFVQKEIRFALDIADEQPEGTIFLIPVRFDQCSVPERLKPWQWVSLNEADGYERLVRALDTRAGTLITNPTEHPALDNDRSAESPAPNETGTALSSPKAPGIQASIQSGTGSREDVLALIRILDGLISPVERSIGTHPKPRPVTDLRYALVWWFVAGAAPTTALNILFGVTGAAFKWAAFVTVAFAIFLVFRLRLYVLYERLDQLKERRMHLLDCLATNAQPRPMLLASDRKPLRTVALDLLRSQRRVLLVAVALCAVCAAGTVGRIWYERVPDLALRTDSLSTVPLRAVSVHPTSSLMALGGDSPKVLLADYVTGQRWQRTLNHDPRVNALSFSPDGKLLAAGGGTAVTIWNMDWHVVTSFSLGDDAVHAVAFRDDSSQIAVGAGTSIVLYEIETGRTIHTFTGHSDTVLSVAFAPNASVIVSGGMDETVRVWDCTDGSLKLEIRTAKATLDPVYAVAVSPGGEYVAIGGRMETISIVKLSDGVEVTQLNGHTDTVVSLAFGGVGRWICSGSVDKTVRVWDVENWSLAKALTGHKGEVSCVTFTPKDDALFSASMDHTVKLWTLAK